MNGKKEDRIEVSNEENLEIQNTYRKQIYKPRRKKEKEK